MKTMTKVLAALTGVVGLIGPTVAPVLQHFITAHPAIAAAIAAASTILALFHNPVSPTA